jgi:hypothetical protein
MNNIYKINLLPCYSFHQKREIINAEITSTVDEQFLSKLNKYGVYTDYMDEDTIYLIRNDNTYNTPHHSHFNNLLKNYLRIQKLNELYE